MCSLKVILSCTDQGTFFIYLPFAIKDAFVNNIQYNGLLLFLEVFCPHCGELLLFTFNFSTIFAVTCTGWPFFPRSCVEPAEFYIYFTPCTVCDHVIDSSSSIDLPVLLPAHCAERIHNALVQDIDVNYCVHDVLMPVPQISTVSIHSDGVFDGGGLASILGNDSDSGNDNDNDYDNVHVVDVVPIDVDSITNGTCNSHLCNPMLAHVRVSDFAHD
jgi:hypothetical protein